jgi:hypothetical protein
VKYEKGCDVVDEAFPESDTFKEPLSAAARARSTPPSPPRPMST